MCQNRNREDLYLLPLPIGSLQADPCFQPWFYIPVLLSELNWTVLYPLLSLRELFSSALRLTAPSLTLPSVSPSVWAVSLQLHVVNFLLATSQIFFSLLSCSHEKDKSSSFTKILISHSLLPLKEQWIKLKRKEEENKPQNTVMQNECILEISVSSTLS